MHHSTILSANGMCHLSNYIAFFRNMLIYECYNFSHWIYGMNEKLNTLGYVNVISNSSPKNLDFPNTAVTHIIDDRFIVRCAVRHTRKVQYIPRSMHTICTLLCFVVVIHWLIFPYPSGLLHWHCGNLTIAPVPAKQPWWIWINTSCELIMNDCITTTKQSTTKPRAYFLGYTVSYCHYHSISSSKHDL